MFFRQKRAMTGVVALILLAMLVVAGCGGGGTNNNDTVASVNGEQISRGEFDSFLSVFSLFYPDVAQMLDNPELRGMIESEMLGMMMQDMLVQQAASDLGITVTDEEVQAEYDSFAAMMGGMGGEFEQLLSEMGITESDLKQHFLLVSIYGEKMEEYFAQDITDEDVQDFLEEHPTYSRRPAMLELSHILFQGDDAEEEALAARERAMNGEDFADLAVELSKDATAQSEDHPAYGGYLGEVAEDSDELVQEFMDGANELSEDGEISQPVETQFGWHLIKLHERLPAQELTFEEAREEAFFALSSYRMNNHLEEVFNQADIQTML